MARLGRYLLLRWVWVPFIFLMIWGAYEVSFISRFFWSACVASKKLHAKTALSPEDVETLRCEVMILLPLLEKSQTGSLDDSELPDNSILLRRIGVQDVSFDKIKDGCIDVDIRISEGIIRSGLIVRYNEHVCEQHKPSAGGVSDQAIRQIGSNVWSYLD